MDRLHGQEQTISALKSFLLMSYGYWAINCITPILETTVSLCRFQTIFCIKYGISLTTKQVITKIQSMTFIQGIFSPDTIPKEGKT